MGMMVVCLMPGSAIDLAVKGGRWVGSESA